MTSSKNKASMLMALTTAVILSAGMQKLGGRGGFFGGNTFDDFEPMADPSDDGPGRDPKAPKGPKNPNNHTHKKHAREKSVGFQARLQASTLKKLHAKK